MALADADKWNAIYQAGGHDRQQPARVLRDHAHLLPARGEALDLACGTGANALFLAQHGLRTAAWDISEQAIERLETRAAQLHLRISTRVCDVVSAPLLPDSFDIIVVSYFLERELIPSMISALRKNGLLYYQTFTRERVSDTGPGNPGYRLAPNELLQLCRDLHLVFYHEEGNIGNTGAGFRDEAMLIGQHR